MHYFVMFGLFFKSIINVVNLDSGLAAFSDSSPSNPLNCSLLKMKRNSLNVMLVPNFYMKPMTK